MFVTIRRAVAVTAESGLRYFPAYCHTVEIFLRSRIDKRLKIEKQIESFSEQK